MKDGTVFALGAAGVLALGAGLARRGSRAKDPQDAAARAARALYLAALDRHVAVGVDPGRSRIVSVRAFVSSTAAANAARAAGGVGGGYQPIKRGRRYIVLHLFRGSVRSPGLHGHETLAQARNVAHRILAEGGEPEDMAIYDLGPMEGRDTVATRLDDLATGFVHRVGSSTKAPPRRASSASPHRRRRGGRNDAVAQAQAEVPTEEEFIALHNELAQWRGHHTGRDDDAFQFDIKVHVWPSDAVKKALGERTAYAELDDHRQHTLESYVEDLQTDYPFFGSAWHTAGRGGGWLILKDARGTFRRMNEFSGFEYGIPTLTGRRPSEEDIEDAMTLMERGRELLAAFNDIDKRIAQAKKDFEAYIDDPETWADLVEDAQRARRRVRKSPLKPVAKRSYHAR